MSMPPTPTVPPMVASDDTPALFAGRLRLNARILAKGLRFEFAHSCQTVKIWEESLRQFAAVVDEWPLRWPDWVEDYDYTVWQALRYLLGAATDRLQITQEQLAVERQCKADASETDWGYDSRAVEAIYFAAEKVGEVYRRLRTWQQENDSEGNRARWQDSWKGELGRFERAPGLLNTAVRRFQSAVRLPSAEFLGDLGDDPRLLALRPYFRLCEVSRRVFHALYHVLTVAPWRLDSALQDEIYRLNRKAIGLMPEGRLRLAVAWREEEMQLILPQGPNALERYLKVAARIPGHSPPSDDTRVQDLDRTALHFGLVGTS